MNLHETVRMTEAMRKYGGRFMRAMVDPLLYADEVNRQRILDAFPEIAAGYGPGSDAYKFVHGEAA